MIDWSVLCLITTVSIGFLPDCWYILTLVIFIADLLVDFDGPAISVVKVWEGVWTSLFVNFCILMVIFLSQALMKRSA